MLLSQVVAAAGLFLAIRTPDRPLLVWCVCPVVASSTVCSGPGYSYFCDSQLCAYFAMETLAVQHHTEQHPSTVVQGVCMHDTIACLLQVSESCSACKGNAGEVVELTCEGRVCARMRLVHFLGRRQIEW